MELKDYRYHHYLIRIEGRRVTSVKKENERGDMIDSVTFKAPATTSKLPKIYLVKHKSDIIYVGATSQGIQNRLRQGLQASGKGGYYGYGFKELNQVDLFVWFFPNEESKITEAIEAEIVYLIRNKTGKWPRHQTEIHFHKATKKEKEIADLIYKIVK